MSIFNDEIRESNVFLNEIALDYNFIPKLIPYRERQQSQIASCIKPLFNKMNGRNALIFGQTGVGKTVACRHILEELEETTDDVIPIYINCWQKNTSYKIILEMCDILGYKFTQNKKTEELFDIVKGIINRKSAVFVFDEVDKAEEFDFLYSILGEIYKRVIILITNYREFINELDDRIKSRLLPELIEFKPYNLFETAGILRQRVEYAFPENVLDDAVIDIISKKTFESGDIRIGLYLLRESGLIAESSASSKVLPEHVKEAIEKLNDFSIKKTDELDDEARKILALIKENSGKRIGEIFKIYQSRGGAITYKSFQRKVNKLDENKFISTEKIVGGYEGTTTILKAAME